MLVVLLVALAAIGVDVASNVAAKQQLRDTVDIAAHAGALALPTTSANLQTVVDTVAKKADSETTVTADQWCVVASTGTAPNYAQIPGTCKPPGTKPYAGTKCTSELCFIPCVPSASDASIKCNTVRVADSKVVPYAFAPAIGFEQGDTGAVVAVACKGSCGTETPNPLDIVVVADRTPSMSANLADLRSSIRSMMTTMDPTMHFLALGTIDAAAAKPTTAALLSSTACPTSTTANHKPRTGSGSSPSDADMKKGWWMATRFSNTYSTKVGEVYALNDKDRVANAVKCLGESSNYYKTHLAAPLRSAVQHLWDADDLETMSAAAKRPGDVRKVVIFETDGAPVESRTQTGNTVIDTIDTMGVNEPRSTTAAKACSNLKAVANAAKDKGTLIITVGFGDAATDNCGSERISTVLADVATDSDSAGCDTTSKRKTENEDGDYFFCATSGAELAPIFVTAFGQLEKGIQFLKMPI
ncbi:vWA domain-containing protein [Nocardioides sp. 616]|uniref:vWA domain-containing protein n=1 Tax=Nocardioides sp. 616 TaxID=2268090 RepID=UPI000CE3225D|nr:vWA domain-containing protein [Nocardioides sp. 616]